MVVVVVGGCGGKREREKKENETGRTGVEGVKGQDRAGQTGPWRQARVRVRARAMGTPR